MMKRASRTCLIALGVLWLAACSNESTSGGTDGSEAAATTAGSVAGESPSDSTAIATESTTTTVADLTDVVHNPASGDFMDGSIVDTRARQVELLVREQALQDKLDR